MLTGIFGRKTMAAAKPESEMVSLSLEEMGQYCTAAARRRGYPEDSLEMIARRVRFLERRDLPGFVAFVREMRSHPEESLSERASARRADGREGGGCPFIAAVLLGERLDEFTALAVGQSAVLPAPSHPLLLLPKLAEHAGPRGIIVMVNWYEGDETVAGTVLDGHRLAHFGSIQPFFAARKIGISRFPEETIQLSRPLRAARIDVVKVPAIVLRRLRQFIETGR